MPVGRGCSLHGFNWALCTLHRKHGGSCGYQVDPDEALASVCTGFRPCDPTALCTCATCQEVAKLEGLCWKCEGWICGSQGTPSYRSGCGHIDSDLRRMRSSCEKCGFWDSEKIDFFVHCVDKGMIPIEQWRVIHEAEKKARVEAFDRDLKAGKFGPYKGG